MNEMQKKANSEFHPLQFRILEPKIQEGRTDYEIHCKAKILAKETNQEWKPITIETCVRISFRPSWATVRAIAKDILININSVFNEMSITRRVLQSTNRGLRLAKTITELKYEDWRFDR